MLIPLKLKYRTRHPEGGSSSKSSNSTPKGHSIQWHLNHPRKVGKKGKAGR